VSTPSSPLPLYHRVNAILRQRIADGLYPPGAQLAPEDELAAEFGVSRSTIRQAVGDLVAAGILSRRQGRGTFVLDQGPQSSGQVLTGNLLDLISEVRRTKIRDVSIQHGARLPARIAEQLGLKEPAGTIVRRTRLRDRVAFCYTVNFLVPEVGRKLTKRDLTSTIMLDLLEQKGHRIMSADQTIRAQLADVAVSEALSIPLGAAVLFVERLNAGEDDRPVELTQSWYRGDLYEFRAALGRSNGDLRTQLA
jgi:GntR family transcriptional regulator